MARSFGNTGSSSLLRAATSAANKTAAFNDAQAAYEFDLSEKTADDINKYNTYLAKRVEQTHNTDPTKALSLQRTATSAYRSFNSAEISRATTQVKFGNISNRDKYAQLERLQQAAAVNGDDNLAQNLFNQMATLSVTIQNEEAAAASRAEASNNKQLAANKRGVDEALRNYDEHVKIAKDLAEQGKLSVNDYQRIIGEAALAKQQLLTKASSGELGGLSEDAMSGYADKKLSLEASDSFKKNVALADNANNGLGSQYLQVDPSLHNPDGTLNTAIKDLPGGVNAVDANGKVIKQFGVGWQGKEDQKSRQDAVKSGSTDYIFPQVGTGAASKTTSYVGGKPIDDGKGNYFVVDQNGRKHYVTTDPNSVLQRSQEAITNDNPYGSTSVFGNLSLNPLENAKTVASQVAAGAKSLITNDKTKPFLSKLPILSGLIRRNDAALEAKRQAEIFKQQQIAHAKFVADQVAQARAQQAQQAKLLPVFRKPVAPAPTPVGQIPKLAPLPGQPGYVNGATKVQQVIKNPNSTPFDAVEALRGGLY